jgi:hypothetical protein
LGTVGSVLTVRLETKMDIKGKGITEQELARNNGKTCCLCECPKDMHVVFWGCPIFEKELGGKGPLICCECCQIDALGGDIDKKFSEKLGRTITKEEINKACGDCGKNHAVQNEYLATQIQIGKGPL